MTAHHFATVTDPRGPCEAICFTWEVPGDLPEITVDMSLIVFYYLN